MFDFIVLDGPPVMGLADAPLLSSVAAGPFSSSAPAKRARASCRVRCAAWRWRAASVVGAVLTKYDHKAAGYGYGYGRLWVRLWLRRELPGPQQHGCTPTRLTSGAQSLPAMPWPPDPYFFALVATARLLVKSRRSPMQLTPSARAARKKAARWTMAAVAARNI